MQDEIAAWLREAAVRVHEEAPALTALDQAIARVLESTAFVGTSYRRPGGRIFGGQVLEVPFPRPRRREEMLARPDYFWLRDSILNFLEECASHPAPAAAPSLEDARDSRP